MGQEKVTKYADKVPCYCPLDTAPLEATDRDLRDKTDTEHREARRMWAKVLGANRAGIEQEAQSVPAEIPGWEQLEREGQLSDGHPGQPRLHLRSGQVHSPASPRNMSQQCFLAAGSHCCPLSFLFSWNFPLLSYSPSPSTHYFGYMVSNSLG